MYKPLNWLRPAYHATMVLPQAIIIFIKSFSKKDKNRKRQNKQEVKQYMPSHFISGAFEDSDVTHIEGEVDPVRDLDVIFHELRAKDLEQLNKRLEIVAKQRDRDKQMKAEYVRYGYI